MKEKQSKTKLRLNICGSILIFAAIVVIISISMFAYAKYITESKGEATANIAQFCFKVNNKSMQDTGNVVFALTRNDGNTKVADNMLAPGTYGHIPIKIEATGSETYIEYTINIDLENKPTNLKFYYDSNKKKEIYIRDNKITREGFISWDDESKIRYENIYWDWPLETGKTLKQIEDNDKEDSKFMNTVMTMNISVIGAQVPKKPIYLADVASIGDYVNYDANSNGTYTKTGTVMEGVTIKDNEPFTTAESVKWRILSVDEETNEITIMAEDPILKTNNTTNYKQVELSGINGYKNIEEGLKEIGSIYGYGKGAVIGRSINLEDVMQYSNYDPTTYKNTNFTPNKTVGDTYTYTDLSRKYILGEEYNEEPVVKVPEGVTVTNNVDGTISASSVTVTQTHYSPGDETALKASFTGKDATNGEKIYNMLFKKVESTTTNKNGYWLASRGVILAPSVCCFNARIVNLGSVYYSYLFYSNNDASNPTHGFMPVVVLKANIKTTGMDNNSVWQLDI